MRTTWHQASVIRNEAHAVTELDKALAFYIVRIELQITSLM